MALMRDKQTKVVREVSESYLRRWPDDYEPVKKLAVKKPRKTTTVEKKSAGGTEKENEQ